MAKQIINTGTNANDGTGDSLRGGGDKLNDNFDEIYTVLGDGENLLTTDIDFGTNKLYFSNSVTEKSDLNLIDSTRYRGLIVHVVNEGALYYAHASGWRKLLADNSTVIANYTDSLDNVAYSGNYNDLSNRPSIPSVLTDLTIVDGSAGQVLTTDGTGNFTFRDVEASFIDFGNVTNKPTTLAGYGINDAFSGQYSDLLNKPTLFSGAYADLTGKPTIPTDVNALTDNDNLLFDGNYTSLNGRPSIPTDVNELTDADGLFFSRSYTDLTNKPTSFTNLGTLQMSLGIQVDEFSNDGGMTDNSASALVTERAVRTYVSAQLPDNLTDLGISDGTAGQVLTTNGSGTFTFQDPGDTIGNFTLAASAIDTDDSSPISIVPAVYIRSDLTVENSLTVSNDATINGNLTVAGDIITTSGGSPEIVSQDTIRLTAPNGIIISDGTTVGGSIIPDTDIAYDLGSVTNRFRDLYLSGNTIVLGNASISATASGGINLPPGTSIPGVSSSKWVPDTILDYGYTADNEGFSDTPVIIDQATYYLAWANGIDDPFVVAARTGFIPTVYTPTMSGGDVVSIAITTPGDYDETDPTGIGPIIDGVNTDNMWALPAGTDINDWAALNTAITNAVPPYGVIGAGVGMAETTAVSTPSINISEVIKLGTSTVAPTNPTDGTIALADGTLWDPLTTGKKTLVIYLSDTWVQIAVAP